MVNHFDLNLFPELYMLSGVPAIFGVMLVVQRPHSRGRLTLSSADPAAPPVVDLNFLADEHDIVRANTNLTSIMIGERAADLLIA